MSEALIRKRPRDGPLGHCIEWLRTCGCAASSARIKGRGLNIHVGGASTSAEARKARPYEECEQDECDDYDSRERPTACTAIRRARIIDYGCHRNYYG